MASDETMRIPAPDLAVARACLERGLAELLAGEALRAAHSLRAAIDADFALVAAHHGHALALRLAGRSQAAMRAALALSILAPKDALAHAALALNLQAAGLPEPAKKAEARAAQLLAEWRQSWSQEARRQAELFPILNHEVRKNSQTRENSQARKDTGAGQ